MSDTADSADTKGLSVPWIEMRRNPDPVSAPLCVALTQVVVEWSKFEYGLVLDLTALRAYPNVRALAPDEPRAFKKVIEHWKQAIHTLFPTVELYKNIASEICSKGKMMSHHRHRIVHGIWLRCEETEKYEYEVLMTAGIDSVRKIENFYVDAEYLEAVATDLKALSDKTYEFAVNRMLHAQQGLLKVSPAQEP